MSKKPVHPFVLVKVGLKNYRSWVLAVIYALTGGTEVRNCIWSVSNPQKLRHPVWCYILCAQNKALVSLVLRMHYTEICTDLCEAHFVQKYSIWRINNRISMCATFSLVTMTSLFLATRLHIDGRTPGKPHKLCNSYFFGPTACHPQHSDKLPLWSVSGIDRDGRRVGCLIGTHKYHKVR